MKSEETLTRLLHTLTQNSPAKTPGASRSSRRASLAPRPKISILFGTRPEIIKLAPIIHELKRRDFDALVVSSGQHADLIESFAAAFHVSIDRDLRVMTENQTPNQVFARVLIEFDAVLTAETPDLVLVQGDTTTALAGATAAFNRKIAVGHVEAGLRSGDAQSPFPEEMNRRLISQLASVHFAATEFNRDSLIAEDVDPQQIFVTGNPVVDALDFARAHFAPTETTRNLIEKTRHLKRVLLTTHRRESFGAAMRENLIVLREFIARHADTALLFPVHPNPSVRQAVLAALPAHERIFLLEPAAYADFVALMSAAWLIVSDSGGVQEEAPTLGKPLLILRENTERPEAVSAGTAKLVGASAARLGELLELNYADETWINSVRQIANPFGDGTAARKIVDILSAPVFSRT